MRRAGSGGRLCVSIHASVWEATSLLCPVMPRLSRFDPRLRVGGDDPLFRHRRPAGGFDPRLRVGGDVDIVGRACPRDGFDPRLRVGGDTPTTFCRALIRSFDPRLRVGGDPESCFGYLIAPVSIHASVWRRHEGIILCGRQFMFRSTPPCGRRPACSIWVAQFIGFRSTPPCGRRHWSLSRTIARWMFRSTPPCGRRQAGAASSP